MLSVNPCLTPAEIEALLKATTKPIPNADDPGDRWFGLINAGSVNAYQAVLAASNVVNGITIDNEVQWDYLRTINGDIIIESGGKLTITSTVKFTGEFNRILVKQGGKLIVDGGILTVGCDNKTWQGIEVWGTPSASQIGQGLQGTVELNGATIEFAELGVSLHQRAPVLLGGGILKASNSKFHNNRRSVSFWDYHNFLPFQPSTTFQNLSYLSDCFFTIDDDFPIENFIVPEFNSHVGLFEVSGIPFSKCIFQDERTNVTKPLQVGSGIYSTNAKFFVNECEFNDLLYGVDANSINATFPFSVRRSTFKGNYSGISARGVNNFTVDDNTFEVGGFTKPVVSANHPTYQTGLFIDQSTGFVVEDNDFKENNVAAASITTNIGICAKNTSLIDDTKNSTDYNEIYGNKFDDLFIGNLANGINRGLLSGLTYLCNENSLDVENVNDFTVHKGVIAKNQIDPNNNSVGNIFTPCTDQDFTHIDNSIDSDFIKYHYSDGSLNDQEEPFCFPDDLVSKLAVSKNECSRGSDHNDFPEDELDEVKSKIEIDKTHFRELLEDYHEAEGEVDSETEIEMTTIKDSYIPTQT